MFCTNCGHRNPSTANFCSACGALLARAGSDTTVALHPIDAQGEVGDESLEVPLPVGAAGTGLLVVERGPSAGTRFTLEPGLTKIGRDPQNDIFLDDVTVSRRHAEIESNGDGTVTVRDVGSLNGTYLNGTRIEEASIDSGDVVQVGKFKLVYLVAVGA